MGSAIFPLSNDTFTAWLQTWHLKKATIIVSRVFFLASQDISYLSSYLV